jgi:preprotein translocase subunit SecA
MKEGEQLEHPLLNRSIETAQRRVEEHNFAIRKRTLEFDDVMNKQREVLYGFRNQIIHGDDPRRAIFDIIEEVTDAHVAEFCPENIPADEWDLKGLIKWANFAFPIGLRPDQLADKSPHEIRQLILDKVKRAYEAKAAHEDPHTLQAIERLIVLNALDRLWQEHLYNMDQLRNAIGLRAYGQRDPLVEYKAEAFTMFEEMMDNVKNEIAANVFRSASSLAAFENFLRALPLRLSAPDLNAAAAFHQPGPQQTPVSDNGADVVDEAIQAAATPIKRDLPKVGRNEPCPCGSGKKYKNCCGKNA